MSTPGHFKIACANCQGHIEFPKELHGQTIDCPHCGLSTVLRVPSYDDAPPASAPVSPVIQKAPEAPVEYGSVKIKSKFIGLGCLVQAAGIIAMFFFFPFGLIAGVIMLIAGGRMALVPVCSICGTRLSDKKVKLCPACKAHFK